MMRPRPARPERRNGDASFPPKSRHEGKALRGESDRQQPAVAAERLRPVVNLVRKQVLNRLPIASPASQPTMPFVEMTYAGPAGPAFKLLQVKRSDVMRKLFVVLAILGTTSVPAASQTAPVPDQSQPAKAQMVKKRVCQMSEEDPSSRLGNRRIC